MTRRELAVLVQEETTYRLEVLWRLEQMSWQLKQVAEALSRVGGGVDGKTELRRKHLTLT